MHSALTIEEVPVKQPNQGVYIMHSSYWALAASCLTALLPAATIGRLQAFGAILFRSPH